MFEYSADLVSATPTVTPWLIPLFLLAAAARAFLRPGAKDWTLEAALLSAAAAVLHLAWLVLLPPMQRALIAHLATAVRIGSLDVSLCLWLDTLSGSVALALALAGTATIAVCARSQEKRVAHATALATGAALLAVLADGLPLVLLGWFGVALAAWIAADDGSARRLAFVMARLAELALLSGSVMLAWGLGGAFGEGRAYTPDFRARVVSVELPTPPANAPPSRAGVAHGYLAMRALPGARVKLGDADLCEVDGRGAPGGIGTPQQPCRRVARSPFAHLPLPAQIHDIRILPGAGTPELRVDKLRVSAERTIELALTGPTLSFSEAAAELALREASGAQPIRSALVARRIGGWSLLELALSLIVVGLSARALLFPFGAAKPHPTIALLGQGAAAYLALRIAAFLSLAPVASAVLAVLACVTALVAAENVARERSIADMGRCVAALALVAASVGADSASAAILVAALPAVAVLSAARSTEHAAARWFFARPLATRRVPWPSFAGVSRFEARLAELAARACQVAAGAVARVDRVLEGRKRAHEEQA